jgi:hypothetical protein
MTPFTPVAAVILVALQTGGQGGGGSPAASSSTPAVASATAQRASRPPTIDGKDDDDVWRLAASIGEFRQFRPVEDADPTVRTEAKVAYDEHNFYAFIRAFDPAPDSIQKLLARRDIRICCDQIKIVIDSYHDRRSGYEFAVNPAGVKRDYAVYNDGNEDDAWDGVWEVGTQVDSLGWTAEFRIPLSQLRYAHRPTNTFGFGVWRDIDRRGQERVSWPLYRVSRTGFISQLGEINGLDGLAAPIRLEVAPYVVAKNEPRAGFERDQQYAVGADIKYGVTSNITIDATVNPDFGQVEADPAVVNLSAFETFFQERRPFFIEGTGTFQFDVNCNIVNCSGEGLFYSRRIGREPQLLGEYGEDDSPTATRILGAAKITGRLPGGLTIGALEAVTQRHHGSANRTIEPLTNYAALRGRQDFRNGESGIGFMLTGVHRDVDEWTDPFLRRSAYAGALDVRHRFAKGRYQISGALGLSRVSGSPSAIAATQRSSVRFYQRPDDNVDLDTTRTSLSGNSAELVFRKFGGFIQYETSYMRRSPGFEINDLGILFRADQQGWNTWGSLNWQNPTRLIQQGYWNFNWWQFWTSEGLPTDRAANTNAHMQLKNRWWVHYGATVGGFGDVFCDRCARGGPAFRKDEFFAPWGGIEGDQRWSVWPNLFVNYTTSDHGRSEYFNVNGGVEVRVSTRFRGSVTPSVTHRINDLREFGFRPDSTGAAHYVFARLDQQEASVRFRLDYTASTTLTIQAYAEPFVSKGRHSDVRELSATPRARQYSDRFQPYAGFTATDFNSKFFNSNVVLRWEYRPGSTLFLVWNQGRSDFESAMGGRSFNRDFGRLFDAYPSNTFLIKASYWLTPLSH